MLYSFHELINNSPDKNAGLLPCKPLFQEEKLLLRRQEYAVDDMDNTI